MLGFGNLLKMRKSFCQWLFIVSYVLDGLLEVFFFAYCYTEFWYVMQIYYFIQQIIRF